MLPVPSSPFVVSGQGDDCCNRNYARRINFSQSDKSSLEVEVELVDISPGKILFRFQPFRFPLSSATIPVRHRTFAAAIYALGVNIIDSMLESLYKLLHTWFAKSFVAVGCSLLVLSAGRIVHAQYGITIPCQKWNITSALTTSSLVAKPLIGAGDVVTIIYTGQSINWVVTTGYLTTFSSAGSVINSTMLNDYTITAPRIGNDGNTYLSTYSHCYCLYPDGSVNWDLTGYNFFGTPAFDSFGGSDLYINVYGAAVMSITTTSGAVNWRYNSGHWSCSIPVVTPNSTVVFGCQAGTSTGAIYSVHKSTGVLFWTDSSVGGVSTSAAAASNGNVYFGSGDTYFYAYSPSGTRLWRYKTGGSISSATLIVDEAYLCFGSADGYVYFLTIAGDLQWRYQASGTPGDAVITPDNTIYFTDGSGRVNAIGANGSLKWNMWLSASTPPAFDSSGVLYVGASDLTLYAIVELTALVAPNTVGFYYTGAVQNWTVPVWVSTIFLEVAGASGGGYPNCGYGALVSSTLSVQPGDVLHIFVGGLGTQSGSFNGGGASYFYGGGGASDIRIGGTALSNRVIVAGGGGGPQGSFKGGAGGYVGADGEYNANGPGSYDIGHGGTQTAGGTCGMGVNGALGVGSTGTFYGGGGGGGYYGGAGGYHNAGGGGGSSMSAGTDTTYKTGANLGDGFVRIYYEQPPTSRPTSAPSAVIPLIGNLTMSFTYTGAVESFTIPSKVTGILVNISGAGGGAAGTMVNRPGRGAMVTTIIPVGAGDVVYVTIGQKGANSPYVTAYNGGGSGHGGGGGTGAGGGGGASDLRIGGVALSNRVVVAGGGGGVYAGSAGGATACGKTGGDGGYNGTAGVRGCGSDTDAPGGGGGTQTSGGVAKSAFFNMERNGTLGVGANGWGFAGGGGGGYYGGGGGIYGGAGGGGSSHSIGVNTTYAAASNSGNGFATITLLGYYHDPTGQPSRQPSSQPTSEPTSPTSQPSGQPSAQPSRQPTRQPTAQPTEAPSSQPSRQPTSQPTSQPSRAPSPQPTGQPTTQPSRQPSRQPTAQPQGVPSSQPSRQPTSQPTSPTSRPSAQPSSLPTSSPSNATAVAAPQAEQETPTVVILSAVLGSAALLAVLGAAYTHRGKFGVKHSSVYADCSEPTARVAKAMQSADWSAIKMETGAEKQASAVLGVGSFGTVVRARYKNKTLVAVKIITRAMEAYSKKNFAVERLRMMEEAKLHHEVTYKLPTTAFFVPFIAVVDGAITDHSLCNTLRIRSGEEATGIVLELQLGGTLDELIHPPPGVIPIQLKMATLVKICARVAHSVADFHAIGMVHGDIKPANIMLSEPVLGDFSDPVVKLADLGFSRMRATTEGSSVGESTVLMTQTANKVGFTPVYTAPEMLRVDDEGYMVSSRSTDVYSLGILIWEVLTGKVPFAGKEPAHLKSDVINGERPSLTALPTAAPHCVYELLAKMWHEEREQRLSAIECFSILDNSALTLSAASYDVFFSHTWSSKPFLSHVHYLLCRTGYKVWYDQLDMGHDLDGSMKGGISNSNIVLVCLNKSYQERPNCMKELRWAVSFAKEIVVLVIEKDVFTWANEEVKCLCKLSTKMFVDISDLSTLSWEGGDVPLAKLAQSLSPLVKILEELKHITAV